METVSDDTLLVSFEPGRNLRFVLDPEKEQRYCFYLSTQNDETNTIYGSDEVQVLNTARKSFPKKSGLFIAGGAGLRVINENRKNPSAFITLPEIVMYIIGGFTITDWFYSSHYDLHPLQTHLVVNERKLMAVDRKRKVVSGRRHGKN